MARAPGGASESAASREGPHDAAALRTLGRNWTARGCPKRSPGAPPAVVIHRARDLPQVAIAALQATRTRASEVVVDLDRAEGLEVRRHPVGVTRHHDREGVRVKPAAGRARDVVDPHRPHPLAVARVVVG